MVTARIRTYTIAIIPAVLFGLDVLISAGMTRTADSQAAVDKEKINRQLEQAVKALDSGDIAAAKAYLEETVQGLPMEEAKTHLGIALNGLHYFNDTKGAKMHIQLVQSSLQNPTG
jgi:Tfp pilus assembly protein PilF